MKQDTPNDISLSFEPTEPVLEPNQGLAVPEQVPEVPPGVAPAPAPEISPTSPASTMPPSPNSPIATPFATSVPSPAGSVLPTAPQAVPAGKEPFNIAALWFIIPMGVVFLFTVIPAIMALILANTDYNPMRGLLGAGSVGSQKFSQLLSLPFYSSLVSHSFFQTMIPAIVATIVGFLSALIIPQIKGKARGIVLALVTLAAFLPEQLFTYEYLRFLNPLGHLPLEPTFFVMLRFAFLVVRLSGVAVLVCSGIACVIKDKQILTISPYIGVAVFFLGQCFRLFSPWGQVELVANPQSRALLETLPSYGYQIGFQKMDYSQAGAAWVVKMALQCVPAVICAIVLLLILRRKKFSPLPTVAKPDGHIVKTPLFIGAFLAGILLHIIGQVVAMVTLNQVDSVFSAVSTEVAIVVGLAVLLALAIPTILASQKAKLPLAAVILFCSSGFAGNYVAEYIMGRNIGLVNGIGGLLLASIFAALPYSLIGYTAVIAFVGGKRTLPYTMPLLGLALVQIIENMMYNIIFIVERQLLNIPATLRMLGANYRGDQAETNLYLPLIILCVAAWLVAFAFQFLGKEEQSSTVTGR